MKLVIPFFLLLLTFSGFGQSKSKTKPKPKLKNLPKCELKAEQLPLVRGLRLGVSEKYVMNLYPTAKFEEPEFSLFQDGYIARIKKSEIQNERLSKNIEIIFITLNDNNVTNFSVYYDDKLTWTSGKEFALKIAESLKVPFEFWEKSEKDSSNFYVFCTDFSIHTNLKDLNPYLSISEDISKSIERIEEKKKTFTP